ncbi:MAG: hypothetical protein H0V79_05760 [Actinobacteria bacterium]|nr:hypothetical protein [Actinomycetota bacterium]
MARLLEETGAAGLGLTELLGRLPVGVGEKLTRLVARGVHDLGALALALLAEPLDLRLAPPELGLPPPNLLLGLAELSRRRALDVRSRTSANSAASRIRCKASIRTAWPVGSTWALLCPAAWSTRSCA